MLSVYKHDYYFHIVTFEFFNLCVRAFMIISTHLPALAFACRTCARYALLYQMSSAENFKYISIFNECHYREREF